MEMSTRQDNDNFIFMVMLWWHYLGSVIIGSVLLYLLINFSLPNGTQPGDQIILSLGNLAKSALQYFLVINVIAWLIRKVTQPGY